MTVQFDCLVQFSIKFIYMNIALHISYYVHIMLNTIGDPLCSILCWDNRPVPKDLK